jgi:hypothetical protein
MLVGNQRQNNFPMLTRARVATAARGMGLSMTLSL